MSSFIFIKSCFKYAIKFVVGETTETSHKVFISAHGKKTHSLEKGKRIFSWNNNDEEADDDFFMAAVSKESPIFYEFNAHSRLE